MPSEKYALPPFPFAPVSLMIQKTSDYWNRVHLPRSVAANANPLKPPRKKKIYKFPSQYTDCYIFGCDCFELPLHYSIHHLVSLFEHMALYPRRYLYVWASPIRCAVSTQLNKTEKKERKINKKGFTFLLMEVIFFFLLVCRFLNHGKFPPPTHPSAYIRRKYAAAENHHCSHR